MKQRIKFNIKIPWTYNSTKMLFIIYVILVIVSDYNVSLQQILPNIKHMNNKRSVEDSTTAVIQQNSISDDAYSKLASNCPSLERQIYLGHSPMGLLKLGVNHTSKFSEVKVPDSKANSLDDCMNECCNSNDNCESVFAIFNSTSLNCYMMTCQEGKYCLPSKSTKKYENSTAVILLRPPNGVGFKTVYNSKVLKP